MGRQAIPDSIQCTSVPALDEQLAAIRDSVCLPESDETWDTIAHAIQRLASLTRGSALVFGPYFITSIRTLSRPLTGAITSERSRLSGIAIDLVCVLSDVLADLFTPLIPLFLPTLLVLCSRTNKVFITRAKACIATIIQNTRSISILPYLLDAAKDKSSSLRLAAAEGALACLNSFNPPDFEKEPRAREVEGIIRAVATDANADVRKIGRQIFEAYKVLLPKRVESFTAPLTPTVKRYLNIKPKIASGTQSNPTSRPQSAQSMHSVGEDRGGLQFSSSTSALQAGPSSGAPRRPLVHERSASSSQISDMTAASKMPSQQPCGFDGRIGQAGRSAKMVDPQRTRKGHGDMLPPAVVPVRPPRTGPQRIGAQSYDTPLTSGPHESVASRKISTGPQAASMTHSEGAARPPQKEPVAGPTRPTVRKEVHHSNSGPIRPVTQPGTATEDAGDRRERVVGGARRVLLPQSSTSGIQAEEMASTHSQSDQSTHSTTAAQPTATKGPDLKTKQVIRTASSRPGVAKAHEKAVPIPKSGAREQPKAAVTATQGRGAADKKQAMVTKLAANRQPADAARPTAHARAAGVREQPKELKPTWGRAPPAKPATIIKRDTRAKHSGRQKISEDPHQEKSPMEVPLPPSSHELVAEALIPLPPSPHTQVQELGATQEPEGEVQVPGEDTPTRPTNLTQEPICDGPATPRADPLRRMDHLFSVEQTPISSLVADIQRGFLFTPCNPLSPPETSVEPLPAVTFSNSTRPLIRRTDRDHNTQLPATVCTEPPDVDRGKTSEPGREAFSELVLD